MIMYAMIMYTMQLCQYFILFYLFKNFFKRIYKVSFLDKCNVLCERTDNEASGSTEALAVTLIKYNYNSIKTTVDTAMLKIEQKYNHTFTNLVRPSLERRALKQEYDCTYGALKCNWVNMTVHT